MKKILISQRQEEVPSYSECREMLDKKWGELFEAIGAVPLPYLSSFDLNALLETVKPDGIFLSGGNDLSSANNTPLNAARDTSERALLRWSLDTGTPIMGVCRGAQLLAEAFGSSLIEISGHVATRHTVSATSHADSVTWYSSEPSVNSYHNYAIQELGEELLPLGVAEDGTIEAFCHREHRVAGILWHPEREAPFCQRDLQTMIGFYSLKDNST